MHEEQQQRRSRRRSTSRSRSEERRHRSHDRQRSRSRDGHKSDRYDRVKSKHTRKTEGDKESPPRNRYADKRKMIDLNELEVDVEDEVAKLVARKIKIQADEEVRLYIASNEFRSMVDTMKRRERERIMSEVQLEIEAEKSTLLLIAKEKLKNEQQTKMDAEEILLQNKLRIEEQRRKEYELKMKQDAERLEEVQKKQKLEAELERQALLDNKMGDSDAAVPLRRCYYRIEIYYEYNTPPS